MAEGTKGTTPLRLMAISGVGFLLSIGLCGGAATSPRASFLFGAGVLVLFASIILFIVAIIWLPFHR